MKKIVSLIKTATSIICCFFLFYTQSFAQNSKKVSLNQTDYKATLRLSPLDLIDFFGPNITIGSELVLTNNTSLGFDYSWYIPYDRNDEYGRDIKVTGFCVRPSFRYYGYTNEKKSTRLFLEPDIMWKRQFGATSSWLNFTDPVTGATFRKLEDFEVQKDVICLNLKAGVQFYSVDNSFAIELYAGLGMRKKFQSTLTDTKNFNLTSNYYENLSVFDFFLNNDLSKSHSSNLIGSITAGIRLVKTFGKRK